MIATISDPKVIAQMETVMADMGDARELPKNDWEMPGDLMCVAVVHKLGGKLPKTVPTDPTSLKIFLEQIQCLDRWHAPILPSNATTMARLDEHDLIFDRLFEEAPRLNQDISKGLMILGQAWGRPLGPTGEELLPLGEQLGLLPRLLDITAYLPPQLTVVDPDEESATAKHYPVDVSYQIVGANAPSLPRIDTLVVAVAPMAEATGDVQMSVTDGRYSLLPSYPLARIDQVLKRAVERDAHVLLMPEMTVDEANLPQVADSIEKARADYFAKFGQAPSLRYVMAGVTAAPDDYGLAKNYIVVLDSDGAIVVKQEKLRHWNLGPGALARFDIEARCPAARGRDLLYENTPPGRRVTVTDLNGIGRMFALICADMNQDQPGHWLLENLQIDWLYSPIMDGSTCWTQAGASPWIIDRSARAAKIGASRVMVANSMTMTQWNNEVIDRERSKDSAYRYVSYETCGIGLLLDGSSGVLRQQHITVALHERDTPVVETRDWLKGWTNYAPPPSN